MTSEPTPEVLAASRDRTRPEPTTVDEEWPYVLPSRDDSVVAAAAGLIGGPVGELAAWRRRWWTPVRVVLAVVTVACCLAFVQKEPCRSSAFTKDTYPKLCYTDIAPLYDGRGFDQGATPYVNTNHGPAARVPRTDRALHAGGRRGRPAPRPRDSPGHVGGLPAAARFFDVNAFLLATLRDRRGWFVAMTHRRRPWDAVMVAPGLVLTAYINWDLLAVALLAGALWAWSRRSPLTAGVLIGLGTAAKLYPAFLLLPLLLLVLPRAPDARVRQARPVGRCWPGSR